MPAATGLDNPMLLDERRMMMMTMIWCHEFSSISDVSVCLYVGAAIHKPICIHVYKEVYIYRNFSTKIEMFVSRSVPQEWESKNLPCGLVL